MSTTPGALMSNGLDFTKTTRQDTYPTIDSTKAKLHGKHVFIVGASRGIGRATAISYAKAGASVIAIAARSDLSSLAKDLKSAASSSGKPEPKIVCLKLDVTSRESVDISATELKKQISHVDVLIINAGVLEPWVPIIDSDPDVWLNSIKTNIFGPYLVTRAVLPLLIASPNADKTIVAVSSIGEHMTMHGVSAYQCGKLALHRMMEFVNAEAGDKGVLAYVIHPGGVKTDMAAGLSEEFLSYLTDTPELAADTLVFLTRERREWLAGRYVSCQWDMDDFLAKRAEIEQGDLLKVRMVV